MVDQASVSRSNGTNNNSHASPLTIVGNIADFGNDIATLAELQAKLAVVDAREAWGRATWSLVALGVGAVVAVGCVPVALIGLADLFASRGGLSVGSARLIVGLGAMALASGVAYLGLKGSLASLDSFRRSREELTRNISWIRTVLVYSGRGGGRRQV